MYIAVIENDVAACAVLVTRHDDAVDQILEWQRVEVDLGHKLELIGTGLHQFGHDLPPREPFRMRVFIQHEHFRFKPGSAQIGGNTFIADDPNHQASLHSSMNIGPVVTWDAYLRYVGALHSPALSDYAELDTRIAWKVTPQLELSLSGFNMIHAHHQEFVAGGATTIPRSFLVDARLHF